MVKEDHDGGSDFSVNEDHGRNEETKHTLLNDKLLLVLWIPC